MKREEKRGSCKTSRRKREGRAPARPRTGWSPSLPVFCNSLKPFDVTIQTATELQTRAAVLTKDVYFEGGDVLRCYKGRFRFVLDGRDPIEISEGEALVTYPEQRVTIEALDRDNLLRYVVFMGTGVGEYFDSFGFFDGLHGKTSDQRIPFDLAASRTEKGESLDDWRMWHCLADALTTYAHDFRDNGTPLVFDAVRQIRANLSNRIVQLKPLCEQLKVSRAYLHRVFVRAGIGTPSEFIRREQLRRIRELLKDPTLMIADVAERTGFLSQTHFSDFVKHYTGHTARELRR